MEDKQTHQKLYNSYLNLDMEVHGSLSFTPHLYRAFIYMRLGGRFSIDRPTRLTFSIGFSGYIYDGKNKSNQLGWSILLGGGFINYLDVSERLIDSGIEIILQNQYNFHKYVEVIFGLSFQYLFNINSTWSTFTSAKDEGFLIGVNMGLAF